MYITDIGMCAKTQEQILVESLFEHYKPEVRPVCNASEAVDVELKLKIEKVDDLVGTGMLRCDNYYSRCLVSFIALINASLPI